MGGAMPAATMSWVTLEEGDDRRPDRHRERLDRRRPGTVPCRGAHGRSGSRPGFEVVGEAESGEDAVAQAAATRIPTSC